MERCSQVVLEETPVPGGFAYSHGERVVGYIGRCHTRGLFRAVVQETGEFRWLADEDSALNWLTLHGVWGVQ